MIPEYKVELKALSKENLGGLILLEEKFFAKHAKELPMLAGESRIKTVNEFLKNERLGKINLEEASNFLSGYGLLDPLFADDKIEEILIDDIRNPILIVHRELGKMKTNLQFTDLEEVDRFIRKVKLFSGVKADKQIVDAQLPENIRVNVTLPPTSFRTPSITIRKYLEEPPSIASLIKNKTLDCEIASFLWLCIEGLGLAPQNIVIAGIAACGKTTILNALMAFTRESERIISIEDTLELDLGYQEDWVRMKSSDEV
ncbi:MAG: ATPase, T2SS/T4P/T4SS family, partial [Candidatus Altiarchaeota archaeon]